MQLFSIFNLCYNLSMNYKDQVFSADEIKGKEFIDCEFENCRFVSTNLRFTSFKNTNFLTCDLSSAAFDLTSFVSCKFPESKLSNVDFSEMQIKDCDFSNSILRNCVFQQLKPGSKNEKEKFDLSRINFENAQLQSALFSFCDLKEANFRGADLESVVFEKCKLKETNFTGANISGTNFSDSSIDGAILDVDGFISFGVSTGFKLENLNHPEK